MTKMVQLADDAYQRLKRAKQEGESFSDVVRRLTAKKGSLLDLAGTASDDEVAEARRRIQDIDDLTRQKMDRRLRDRGIL